MDTRLRPYAPAVVSRIVVHQAERRCRLRQAAIVRSLQGESLGPRMQEGSNGK